MHRTLKKMLLPDMRASDVHHSLEHVLEVVQQEQANPYRPRVAHLVLVEPDRHLLPVGVREKAGRFFGMYDCPKHLVDPSVVPLLWANMTPSTPCKEDCCGECPGGFQLELWQDGRFPLQPFEVCMLLVDDLRLTCSSTAAVPQAWIPFCLKPSGPPEDDATVDTRNQSDDHPISNDESLCLFYFQSCNHWLKDQMRAQPNPEQYDQFYDGWMDKYKEDHGVYPRDSARAFSKVAERCLREIWEERNGGTSEANQMISSDHLAAAAAS
jgi:hypothetical protein